MNKPLYGTVEILLYADDVPGKMQDEQAEAKEREFQRVTSQIQGLIENWLVLEENWDWGFAPV